MSPPSSVVRPRIPSATYRLQFNKEFTFRQAREIVGYLHDLGISDCYASPFFQASPGSMHGYDVVDHNKLNSEVGSEEDFAGLVAELKKYDAGLVADFVPNHMGISQPENLWWMDVLENGPSSLAAPCFDIDWHPLKAGLENKVLLPILGDQYGRVLERGEFQLKLDGGAFYLHYFETKLPINPRTYNQILTVALAEVAPPAPTVGTVQIEYSVSELQSIMTQLENMPARTTQDHDQIVERAREKEVAKMRLDQLFHGSPKIADAITRAIERFQGKPGDARSFDLLDHLIDEQAYRLSYWRVAAEEINYRRFFDINSLAAIRMELPEVFDATHQLLWRLLESGAVTGLRIDHPDGLYDPRGYFTQLQQNFARLRHADLPEDGRGIYLLGEKILLGEEKLREDWPVHGTTGYEFTNQVTALLVDPDAEKAFSEIYQRFIDRHVHFASLVYEKKRLTMRLSLANDINVLGYQLDRLSERNRLYRDYTLDALTTAVREVIACFPVYRTYLAPGQPLSAEDKAAITRAVALAKRRNQGIETSVFDFLRDILLFRFPPNTDQAGIAEHERFVMKFQQCTGPIMAKGLEDTAFYIYNRLVALNEVGGEPEHFGNGAAKFHAANAHRAGKWPHSMLASTTHDTKRSEDTRARIAALSEMPKQWKRALRNWSLLNRKHKTSVDGDEAPDANEEYLLYQILLGTWPVASGEAAEGAAGVRSALRDLPAADHAKYVERIQDYMTKAIKEAKVNSSWIQPNDAWDEAVRKFIAALLKRGRAVSPFIKAFAPFAEEIARLGMLNSLLQTVLKLTVPGVPDIYQGNELWDFTLVDPDNRRPVDYALRRQLLDSVGGIGARALLESWPDGRVKLFVTRAILHYRREQPDLFGTGSYLPLEASGKFADCAVAFERISGDRSMLVIAPRLTSRVGFLPIGERWGDTAVTLQKGNAASEMRDVLTGRTMKITNGRVPLAEALAEFPCAVFAA